jgi:hypothetical protein
MSLFETISDWNLPWFGVGAAVGGDDPPQPADARRTRGALDLLGYRRDAEGDGQAGMLDDLRDFQRDNGLKVDGLMNPGGPTEKTLGDKLTEADPADVPAFPRGDTVDRRIRSLMEDPRYPDDARLRQHVERQFETAYPGEARFDESGRMEKPLAEITPAEVSPFDPRGVLAQRRAARTAGAGKFDPADYTGDTGISVPPEETTASVRDAFRAAKEKQDASDAWEKALLPDFAGGDRTAFEAAVRRLGELREQDAEAYGRLSADTRAVHRAYEKSREAYEPIKKKALELGLGTEEDLNARFDQEAFDVAMHVGALRNADSAIKEPLAEAVTRIGQAWELLSTGKVDAEKFDKMLEDIRSSVPAGYRDSPVYGQIRDATDLAVEIAKQTRYGRVPGRLADVGEIADEISRRGTSSPQQLAATALYLATSDAIGFGGRKAAKGSAKAAEKMGLLSRDGIPDWLKRIGEFAMDTAADQAGQATAKGVVVPKR